MAHDGDQVETAGSARCPGVGWDELMAADTIAPPEFMKADAYEYMGSAPLATARYTDAGFFQRELKAMWPNVWQFAARDEELPDPGDVVVYENAGRSYLITRQADGSVKALHNVCLHRGRKLRLEFGFSRDFKCPYHGFTWNTDGSLKEIPCRWDFGHLATPDASARGAGRPLGRLHFRQGSRGWPEPRGVSRPACRNISNAGSTRSASPPAGSARSSPPTGRPPPRRSWRRGTRWSPTRRSCRSPATPTPATTSMATT